MALAIYGAGLPAFVLQKVWQPLFYAREDTRRPFQFAVMAMVVWIFTTYWLAKAMKIANAAKKQSV